MNPRGWGQFSRQQSYKARFGFDPGIPAESAIKFYFASGPSLGVCENRKGRLFNTQRKSASLAGVIQCGCGPRPARPPTPRWGAPVLSAPWNVRTRNRRAADSRAPPPAVPSVPRRPRGRIKSLACPAAGRLGCGLSGGGKDSGTLRGVMTTAERTDDRRRWKPWMKS